MWSSVYLLVYLLCFKIRRLYLRLSKVILCYLMSLTSVSLEGIHSPGITSLLHNDESLLLIRTSRFLLNYSSKQNPCSIIFHFKGTKSIMLRKRFYLQPYKYIVWILLFHLFHAVKIDLHILLRTHLHKLYA